MRLANAERMLSKSHIAISLCLSLLLALSGCGALDPDVISRPNSKSGSDSSQVTLVGLEITPSSISISMGSTEGFGATGIYSDGSAKDLTGVVSWQSSASGIATIGASSGVASSVAAGSAQITASLDGIVSNPATLSISAATLFAITVSPSAFLIAPASTEQFSATGLYTDGTEADFTRLVTWVSSRSAVATINHSTGLAAGAATGSSQISATYGGMTSNLATLTVSAATLNSIKITPISSAISMGSTQQFVAIATYSDGSSSDVTASVSWQSNTTGVATVASTGLASSTGVGSLPYPSKFERCHVQYGNPFRFPLGSGIGQYPSRLTVDFHGTNRVLHRDGALQRRKCH